MKNEEIANKNRLKENFLNFVNNKTTPAKKQHNNIAGPNQLKDGEKIPIEGK